MEHEERSNMSAITQEQSARVGKFMTEFWKDEMKAFYNPEDSQEYWDAVVKKTSEICDKYAADDVIVRNIAMAFVSGLEKAQRNQDIKSYEYMYKSDDFIDALNRLFKWFKEGDEIFKDLQNAFKSAHKVKLADGSLQAARVVENKAQ